MTRGKFYKDLRIKQKFGTRTMPKLQKTTTITQSCYESFKQKEFPIWNIPGWGTYVICNNVLYVTLYRL
jgi:hypothetical protein